MHHTGTHRGWTRSWLFSLGIAAILGAVALHMSWHVVDATTWVIETNRAAEAQRISGTTPAAGAPASLKPSHPGRSRGSIPEMREAHFTVAITVPAVVSRRSEPEPRTLLRGVSVLAACGRSPPPALTS